MSFEVEPTVAAAKEHKRLSTHFELWELSVTSRKLANNPTDEAIQRALYWCEFTGEPFRQELSDFAQGLDIPLHINSWFRSYEVNRAAGGEKLSQHRIGEAVDCYPDFGLVSLEDAFLNLWWGVQAGRIRVDQAIIYPSRNFLHLSFTKRRLCRSQFLSCAIETVKGVDKKVFHPWSPKE